MRILLTVLASAIVVLGCRTMENRDSEALESSATTTASSQLYTLLIDAGFLPDEETMTASGRCTSGITVNCSLFGASDDVDERTLTEVVGRFLQLKMGESRIAIECTGRGKKAVCTINGKKESTAAAGSSNPSSTGTGGVDTNSAKINKILVDAGIEAIDGERVADMRCTSGITVSCSLAGASSSANLELASMIGKFNVPLGFGGPTRVTIQCKGVDGKSACTLNNRKDPSLAQQPNTGNRPGNTSGAGVGTIHEKLNTMLENAGVKLVRGKRTATGSCSSGVTVTCTLQGDQPEGLTSIVNQYQVRLKMGQNKLAIECTIKAEVPTCTIKTVQ